MSKKRDERTLHERIDELRARAKELADSLSSSADDGTLRELEGRARHNPARL